MVTPKWLNGRRELEPLCDRPVFKKYCRSVNLPAFRLLPFRPSRQKWLRDDKLTGTPERGAATHHSGETRIQSLGRQPDAGRLRAPFHRQERPAVLLPSASRRPAIGAISFLALEAIGGAITLSYGTTNAFFAIIVASIAMLVDRLADQPIRASATASISTC